MRIAKRPATICLIVGMDRYAIASEVSYYGGRRSPSGLNTANSGLFGGMGLMFDRWMPPQVASRSRPAVGCMESRRTRTIGSSTREWSALGPIEDDVLMRDGVLIRHYYHRLAYQLSFSGRRVT